MMGLGEGDRKRITTMWHLVGLPSYKNLGEALEGFLAHHLATERKRQTHVVHDSQAPVWLSKQATKCAPKLERLQQARREERLAQYTQVIALYKQGVSQQVIAQRVGVGYSTVQRWLAAGTFPERKPADAGKSG
jgi:DNA-binding transcriptional regulator YiaG